MAHHNFQQLQLLLELLDDERNDIYLHVDRKAKDFCPADLTTRASRLYLIDRIPIIWGGHSMIKCELNLLKVAASKHYHYYHLLSGVDLPLKTQDEIHSFFQGRTDSPSYLGFSEPTDDRGFMRKISSYYFLQDVIGRNQGGIYPLLRTVERISLGIQRRLNVRRKEFVPTYKGANWFSIHDDLAQYVLGCERLIKKQFFYTVCADEMFLQSVAMASPLRDRIINNSLRAIDWERGGPYTYRQEDVAGLLDSPMLFGRKFDVCVDAAAVQAVVSALTSSAKT
jgi:hypothetical protein